MPAAKPPTVTTDQARKNLSALITAAARDGKVTIISRNGIPACAIVPLSVIRQFNTEGRRTE